MRLRKRFTPHTVTARTYAGRGSRGERYDDPRTIADVWVVDERIAIIDADGNETVSNTQVSTDVDEILPLKSLVTVWAGTPDEREATVLKVSIFRHRRLPQSRIYFLT